MFNFFFDEEKDKTKNIFGIFSKYHIFNFSDDILEQNIIDFEKISGKVYLPKLSKIERFLHVDINLKAEKTLCNTLNIFEKNINLLQSKVKMFFN